MEKIQLTNDGREKLKNIIKTLEQNKRFNYSQFIQPELEKPLFYLYSDLACNVINDISFDRNDRVLIIGDLWGNISKYIAEKVKEVVVIQEYILEQEIFHLNVSSYKNITIVSLNKLENTFNKLICLEEQIEDSILEMFVPFIDREASMFIVKKGATVEGNSLFNMFQYEQKFLLYPDENFTMYLIDREYYKENLDMIGFPYYNRYLVDFYKDSVFIHMTKDELYEKGKYLIELKQLPMKCKKKYVKYSNERKSNFKIKTEIIEKDNKLEVYKIPMNKNSCHHILNMIKIQDIFNNKFSGTNFEFLQCNKYDISIHYPYIVGNTLYEHLIDLISQDFQLFLDEIKKVYEIFDKIATGYFVKTKEFVEYFGNRNLSPRLFAMSISNLDSIFQNIILSDDKYYFIDYEWTIQFPIPINFIKWRCLFYFFKNYEDILKNMESVKEIYYKCLKDFNIGNDEEMQYIKMEDHFQRFIHL